MIQNNDYPYTIPESATLVKTGMYYYEKNVVLYNMTVTLREIYADYGWVIYNVAEMQAHLENPELPVNYSYMVGGLQSSSAISNWDVCKITDDIKIGGLGTDDSEDNYEDVDIN